MTYIKIEKYIYKNKDTYINYLNNIINYLNNNIINYFNKNIINHFNNYINFIYFSFIR